MKPPVPKTFTVTSVGPERQSRRGDPYVECRTDLGTVAFWGGAQNVSNIQKIAAARLPVTITCGCIEPSSAYSSRHSLWVPQGSRIAVATAVQMPGDVTTVL